MRKKWLQHMNTILGAISFGLIGSGCASPNSPECKYGPPEPVDLYGCPPPEEIIMAKYACPPEMLEPRGEWRNEYIEKTEEIEEKKQ